MKKYFALLLSFVMVLSLAACGDDAEKKSDKTEPAKTEAEQNDSSDDEADNETTENEIADEVEVSDDLISLLEQLSIVEPTDAIVGTEWELSGGMVDGVEMEEADLAASLEMYGGKLSIVFVDAENVSMVQGGGTLEGIYGLTDNENVLGLIFESDGSEVIYAGLFADVDDTLVLMLFPDGSGKNAVYFTQSDER